LLTLFSIQPRFPTFPHALSPSQVSAGLAAPAAAAVVMGKGGAIAVLLVVLYVYIFFQLGKRSVVDLLRRWVICVNAAWL
jgi:hypothetical protein